MKQIYFILTETCNLSCSHCIRESSPLIKNSIDQEIYKKAIFNIYKNYPLSTVILTGGEPTLYKNFLELLIFTLDLKLNVCINSNGINKFFQQSNLENLLPYKSNLSFQLSLDGIEEIHDSIRGANTFQKTLKSLNLLSNLNYYPIVNLTITNTEHLSYLVEFIELLNHMNLNFISIKLATCAGRAFNHLLDVSLWNETVYFLRSQSYRNKIHIYPMYDFDLLDSISDKTLDQMIPQNVNCGAGTDKIYIYPNGNVCSCTCFKSKPIGNLYEIDLDEIIKSYLNYEIFHIVCNSCRYKKLCNGGCLGSGYNFFNEFGSPDPRCPKIKAYYKL